MGDSEDPEVPEDPEIPEDTEDPAILADARTRPDGIWILWSVAALRGVVAGLRTLLALLLTSVVS